MTLVFEGSLEERVGQADEAAGPLSVVIKPAGVEHANRIGETGATTLQLTFDRGFFTPNGPGNGGMSEWGWIHGGPVAAAFLKLLRRTGVSVSGMRPRSKAWSSMSCRRSRSHPQSRPEIPRAGFVA